MLSVVNASIIAPTFSPLVEVELPNLRHPGIAVNDLSVEFNLTVIGEVVLDALADEL